MTNEDFKLWRKHFKWTQEQAAEKLDMKRRQIQKYEAGEADIPLVVALACAAIANGLSANDWQN